MGSNVVSFPFRVSSRMALKLNALVNASQGETKSQLIQNMTNQFLMHPQTIDPKGVFDLREPVTETISVSLPEHTYSVVQGLAEKQSLSVSALMRNILYLGLKGD